MTLKQHKAIDRILNKLPAEFRERYFKGHLQAVLQLTAKEASAIISVLIATTRYQRYLKRKSRRVNEKKDGKVANIDNIELAKSSQFLNYKDKAFREIEC